MAGTLLALVSAFIFMRIFTKTIIELKRSFDGALRLVDMRTTKISIEDLEPGDVGFGPISGAVGLLVGLGQLLLGDEARFRHVFIVTQASVSLPSQGRHAQPAKAVEAMPSGARLIDISDRWNESYVYVRLNDHAPEVRWRAAVHALAMIGTPYSFSDYLALFLKRLGINTPRLDRWISRLDPHGYPRRAICSQLVDFALSKAGIKVFDDGRLSQNVVPGALFYQLLRIGGVALWPRKPPVAIETDLL
jgi:hypothetical protein